MFKLIRNSKFIKFVTMMLVVVFCVNLTGCESLEDEGYNGVSNTSLKNYKVGKGANTIGYTVYAESSFDPMSKETFMGYLLNGREFTLVVLRGGYNVENGEYTSNEEDRYVFNPDTLLFSSAQAGIYKFDERSASFQHDGTKILMYYVTDNELNDWFEEFKGEDTFMKKAMNFAKSTVNVEDPSRYTCRKLVNMGRGLSADDFCNNVMHNVGDGMILLFGYSSIEGYIRAEDIENYTGSEVANSLTAPCGTNCFNLNSLTRFNITSILNGNNGVVKQKFLEDKDNEYAGFKYNGQTGPQAAINAYNDGKMDDVDTKNSFVQKIIELYTEVRITAPGITAYERLKTTYEMLGSALLTDANYGGRISQLKSQLDVNVEADKIKYDLITQVLENFNDIAKKEAYNIKLSSSIYSRYDSVKHYPTASSITNEAGFTDVLDINLENAVKGVNGELADDYLFLVTADGFVIDRGNEATQKINGQAEMLGIGTILAELVRMDSCPNATIAADMYNMLANLKIAVGIAVTVAGVSAVAVASIGLAVAAVIAKLAAISTVTPVPGARIVALVLIAIAGLVALGVGIYTLVSGLQDKARLKGMGASETNYCSTYKATFESLFESIALTIPVYHYKIPAETEEKYNANLSMKYYNDNGEHSDGIGKYDLIQLYSYADVQTVEKLNVVGAPMLMYFQDGKMADYINGAATPEYIVEMLRLWGLLAMREIVYTAKIADGSKVVAGSKVEVHRTANSNVLTHSIKEAKYCFNLTYGQDLYKDGADCAISSINTQAIGNTTYYKNQGKPVKNYDVTIPDISTLNFSGLSIDGESAYSKSFLNTDLYKFNSYLSDNKSKLTLVTPTDVKVSIRDKVEGEISAHHKVIDIYDSEDNVLRTILDYEIVTDTDGDYYITKNNSENALYFAAAGDVTQFKKLATFTTTSVFDAFSLGKRQEVGIAGGKINFYGFNYTIQSSHSYKVQESNGSYVFTIDGKKYLADSENPTVIIAVDGEYGKIDLLRFINDKLPDINEVFKIPFYFTTTVRQSSLKRDEKKEDKFIYTRTYKFIFDSWTWQGDVSIPLDKVRESDVPHESEDNYYSSSLLLGYIELTMEKGTTNLKVNSAKYLGDYE